MGLFLDVKGTKGRRGPSTGLVLTCSVKWQEAYPAFLLGLTGRLLTADERVLSESVSVEPINWSSSWVWALLEPRYESTWTLSFPLSREAIQFIEEHRGDGDVTFILRVSHQWQRAIPWQDPNDKNRESWLGGAVKWDLAGMGFPVPRSDWLKRLAEMEWSETELFEVPTLAFNASDALAEALRFLQEARTALQQGNHDGVLQDCYAAFSSAATYAGKDKKAGYEALLLAAYPDCEEKRGRLNGLIARLNEFCHLGRHPDFPTVRIERAEAICTLATTVAVFALLGKRLQAANFKRG